MVEIFTDGSSRGNPGPGGFGVVMRYKGNVKEISKGYRLTTNNRMELLAVIVGLEAMKRNDLKIRIVSDSKYVVDAINKKWVFGWQKKGFKGKKNPDLWRRYLKISAQFKNLEFVWIKGHAGHPENERCDELAVERATGSELLVDAEFEALTEENNSLL
ncbi:ribonuclease HI [Aureibacter tunicatorum]|uniref:ribonuclease H n=1 Tax=Aureibacter tunicatorum TaxID=866807 RepID=A0AAE4BT20_9BACT|nr:ribonuclease HI [Aureibacter tunicatorum]MDR6239022.1 ribonuclease HI [Aureibacter tunicatorum]BDD05052.1 ribonuclease H [Aureibacter tunicatorum]